MFRPAGRKLVELKSEASSFGSFSVSLGPTLISPVGYAAEPDSNALCRGHAQQLSLSCRAAPDLLL